MPDQSATLPAARMRRARTRLAGVAGAAAAAVAVWLVARYGAGLHPYAPGFSSAQRPASLAPGFVAILAAAASLLAWAALTLIERIARRPRRVWVISGFITLAVSLSAPLSGHGVTGTDRLTLICMHLAVAAVLVPIFASTISPGRPASNDSGRPGRQTPFSARRQQDARAASSGGNR
jgi:phosphotransferase system  glucose/maltose/N-acetylglucosamine-specific IIC component